VLHQVLHNAVLQKQQSVPLSNVKRIFRSQYKVELSETVLGYAKLSELLRDAFVSDLCIVELRQSGYVMIPRQEKFITRHEVDLSAADQVTPRCGSDSEFTTSPKSDGGKSDVTASPQSDSTVTPMSGSSPVSDCSGSPKSDTSSPRRRPTLWVDLDDDTESVTEAPSSDPPSSDPPSYDPETKNLFGMSRWPLSPSKMSEDGCIGGMIQRTFIHHPPPPPTPSKGAACCSNSRIRSLSVPKNFGSTKFAFADALHSLVYLHRPVWSDAGSEADNASNKSDSPISSPLTPAPLGPPELD